MQQNTASTECLWKRTASSRLVVEDFDMACFINQPRVRRVGVVNDVINYLCISSSMPNLQQFT